jgi:hypothetical protein
MVSSLGLIRARQYRVAACRMKVFLVFIFLTSNGDPITHTRGKFDTLRECEMQISSVRRDNVIAVLEHGLGIACISVSPRKFDL